MYIIVSRHIWILFSLRVHNIDFCSLKYVIYMLVNKMVHISISGIEHSSVILPKSKYMYS